MPKLFVFLLKNIALGAIIGWSFIAGILYFDIGGFGSLVFASQSKFLVLTMLAIFFAITFSSASVATATLLGHDFLPKNDDKDQNNSQFSPHFSAMVPVKISRRNDG